MIRTVPPRAATVIRLVAGRSAFRLGVQAMAVVLVAVWGGDAYGRFANAIGLCSWLVFVPTAAEKAALKAVPRAGRTAAAVAGLALRLATAPVLALVLAVAVALVVAPGSTAALYLAAAAWWTCTGLLMTVSGLHRLRGRAVLDALAFGAAAVVVAVGTGGAWLGGLSPHGLLLVLLAGTVAITAAAITALPREWVRHDRLARRLAPAFVRSTWLLGLSELVAAATVSSVYLVLAAVGRVTDSGPFYLAMMASSLVCSFLLYQLKLHQPAASTRLRGTAGAGGRARATTLLRLTEHIGLALAAALVLALLVPASRDALRDPDGYLVLGVLVAVETATAMVLMYAGFLLENTNSRVLAITGSTSVLRFAANLLFALALVPALGSVGGFAAIVLAMAAQAGALRRLLVRRHPELAGTAPA